MGRKFEFCSDFPYCKWAEELWRKVPRFSCAELFCTFLYRLKTFYPKMNLFLIKYRWNTKKGPFSLEYCLLHNKPNLYYYRKSIRTDTIRTWWRRCWATRAASTSASCSACCWPAANRAWTPSTPTKPKRTHKNFTM